MRRRFSERYGFKKPRDTFQIESMDIGLKNRIWSIIKIVFIDDYIAYNYNNMLDSYYREIQYLYGNFFKVSDEPSNNKPHFTKDFKDKFFNLEWMDVYDLLEYVQELIGDTTGSMYDIDFDYCIYLKEKFINDINEVLESEMSAYRFVGDYIAPIIDEVEIKEIEEALDIQYSGAKRHLSNALELLSDRENPNYPNSIKESISAVEAVAKEITGKQADLSKCLKAMDLDLNKQFKTAMDNMYGWTNKEDGIRHGHTGEELKTSFEEAKYMLVICSAFVNYMIAKKIQK